MLSDKKKVELIRKIAKDNNISSYHIGENTSVSNKTAYNILNDDEINPRTKTLNIILDYLEKAIVGTKGNAELVDKYTTEFRNSINAAEEESNYKKDFNNLKIDDKLNILYQEQQKIEEYLSVLSGAMQELLLFNIENSKAKKTKK